MLSIQDILKLSPEDIIAAVARGDLGDIQLLTIPLDTALVNDVREISGMFFGVISTTDISTSVNIEFNHLGSGKIPFTQGLYLDVPFNKIYITSDAQAGKTITFIYTSQNPIFKVTDNRSNQLQAQYLSDMLDQLRGQTTKATVGDDVSVSTITKVQSSASGTRAVFIFADQANTDVVYLGSDNTTASTHKIIALSPGESFSVDDYRGDIYAIAGSGTQKLSVSSW